MNIYKNEPMSKHNTFRTGGNAKVFIKASSAEDIRNVITDCMKTGEKLIIIGNGSNLLISDKGLDATVLQIYDEFNKISLIDDERIYAESGALLSKIAAFAKDNSLKNLEFASGIPGTLGGAVMMNAGAYDGEMKFVVEYVDVLEYDCADGTTEVEEKRYTNEEMQFDYRTSLAMKKNMIVLGACLKLEKGEKSEIVKYMQELAQRRKSKQPLEYPSAGSTFKRPVNNFAGKLIMDSGLAGFKVGGAMVSTKHCGFIINYDNATSTDIYDLIRKVQEIVYEKTGVMLETEVRLIGDFS